MILLRGLITGLVCGAVVYALGMLTQKLLRIDIMHERRLRNSLLFAVFGGVGGAVGWFIAEQIFR